ALALLIPCVPALALRRGDPDAPQNRALTDEADRLEHVAMQQPRAHAVAAPAPFADAGAGQQDEHGDDMPPHGHGTDPAEVATLSAEANRIEDEFDSISTALRTSGTEKGRALAAQKLTINQDFQLVSVLNRAKAAKGAELTAKQRAHIEALTKRLEES